jgi:eukaryotic-like serine/threonine-protein kinase
MIVSSNQGIPTQGDLGIPVAWPAPGAEITTARGLWYRVGQPINSGEYALVYDATDILGTPVALKVFQPAPRPFQEVESQWRLEIRVFEKLRHPNVVSIYDAFVCGNLFYIVLERAWGSLADYIGQITSMDDSWVRELARQLLNGICHIHLHGVIHRDLSIANILVHEPQNGWPTFKISDFGISKEFIDPWQAKICTTRTAHPWFAPPELIQHGYTNEISDLYHLGLILLFALTGHLPFDRSMTQQQIEKTIVDGVPRQLAESVGTPLGNFISVLLRRRLQYRFQSALEALNYLQHLQ